MAGTGGKRAGSGRQKGTPNKATLELQDLARQYSTEAIDKAVYLMRNSANESVQVKCAEILLDRGYGKPPQAIIGDPEKPLNVSIVERRIVRPKT